jgi:hypothetical protein
MRAASRRPTGTAATNRNCFQRLRFGDSAAVGGDSSVVVFALLVTPVSVVVVSDDMVSDVVVSEVIGSADVVVLAVVVIGVGTAAFGRLEWFAVCTTANTIATNTSTPPTPAATTAVVV